MESKLKSKYKETATLTTDSRITIENKIF